MSGGLACPNCRNEVDARICGNEVRGVYDGVLYWHCLDCRYAWQRWPEGDWRHGRAEPFVQAHNIGRGSRP